MRKTRALVAGDRLAVVAPASAFDREQFDQGLEELRRLGFEPVYDDSVFARHRYLAGGAELRAAALIRAWSDQSIAGIIAVRGGYGSAQLLPLIDPALVRRAAKPLIGYSDITTLLNFQTLTCGVVSFHGPMLDRRLGRGDAGYDRDTFVRALCQTVPLGDLAPDGLEVVRPGDASGPLLGGTLTQLLATLGTPYAFDPPHGYVLLLDEVGERPYRLDRMVTQARQAGLLARANAVVIGELPNCDEPGGDVTGRSVMAELFADFPGPVIIGFPTGHTCGPTFTLPLGVTCRVVATGHPRLVIEESAVVQVPGLTTPVDDRGHPPSPLAGTSRPETT
ncbi:MAG: LD-carboxypeptidase [Vicinamibacterales bacterium]